MIEKHVIKVINNEEVLVIYLNYNYEFGTFEKKKSIVTNIRDYILHHKIKFNGKIVMLMVSGLILGTMIIPQTTTYNEPFKYIDKVILNNYNLPLTKIESVTIIEPKEEKKVIVTTKKANVSVSKPTTKKTTKKVSTTQKNTIVKKKSTTINTNVTLPKEEANKTMVTIYRSNGETLKIELEEYLVGVIAYEMPASFNIEALKAQAVVARTYALKSINNGKKLTDTASTQGYKDVSQMKSTWGNSFDKYYNKIKDAVNSTKGITIKYNGTFIDAVYHATSNGMTEDANNVWGYSIPYLKSVNSSWDQNTTPYYREITMSIDEVNKLLKTNITEESVFGIVNNNSNYVNTFTIDELSFTGKKIRELLNLRSTDFEFKIDHNNIIISTKGYGHGVGMSQYGANEMAKNGSTYKDIIKHYYTGVKIG